MDFSKIQIGQLMSKQVKTVPADGRIMDHVTVFEENKIHHAPVVDKKGEVAGMLSSRDIESFQNIISIINSQADEPVLIRDIMTSPIFSYFEDVSIKAAAEAMLDNRLHAVVVVDKNEKMVGIVTATDLLKFIATNGASAKR